MAVTIEKFKNHDDYRPKHVDEQSSTVSYCVSNYNNNPKLFNSDYIKASSNNTCMSNLCTALNDLRKSVNSFLEEIYNLYNEATSISDDEWRGNMAFTFKEYLVENLYNNIYKNIYNKIIESNIQKSVLDNAYEYYAQIVNDWNTAAAGCYSEWEKIERNHPKETDKKGKTIKDAWTEIVYIEGVGGRISANCNAPCTQDNSSGGVKLSVSVAEITDHAFQATFTEYPKGGNDSKLISVSAGRNIRVSKIVLNELNAQIEEHKNKLELLKNEVNGTIESKISLPEEPEKYVTFNTDFCLARTEILSKMSECIPIVEGIITTLSSYITTVNAGK